ncbi:MAG: hypothetical protein QXX41_03770 [Nitrososphaerota archaeon]
MVRWIDKNVDLGLLVEKVQSFLVENGFKANVEKFKDGWIIVATKHFSGEPKSISIKFLGSPNDFTIDFSGAKYKHDLRLLLPFINFIGLGVFFRRELEFMDFLKVFEDDFWVYVEKTIDALKLIDQRS